MNILLLKQISVLSFIAGIILGLISVIPYLSLFSFLIAVAFVSVILIVYLKQQKLIGIINVREGCIMGGFIGFISFIGFSVSYAPISMLLGKLIKSYTQGFLRYFLTDFGTFFTMILLMLLMAGICALFNAFSGLITAYVYEFITGEKKNNDENTSIDFEIR